MANIQLRCLSRTSVPPYTRHPTLAMPHEPEAITADEQWLITHRAGQRELRAWDTSRQRLLAELEHLRTHVHNPHVDRHLRALEREITALHNKLSRAG